MRFTLALAKLQQRQKLPALTLLQQANIPSQNLTPNQLLILSANNEPEKAGASAPRLPKLGYPVIYVRAPGKFN